jgi:glycosyltransferase involved in cell wall biosynthesis
MTEQITGNKRVKVAVLIGTLEVGGAELDIVRNFPRLNRDEFDVVVLTFGAPGALAPELERQGIPVISRPAWESRAMRAHRGGKPTAAEKAGRVARHPLRSLQVALYPLYERFVLSLPVGFRQSVKPPRQALGAAVHSVKRLPKRIRKRMGRAVRATRKRLRPVKRWLLGAERWINDLVPVPQFLKRRRRRGSLIGTLTYMASVVLWIRATLTEESADVVHSFLPHSYAYGMVAGALMRHRPRQVMSRLSLNFYMDTHPVLAWMERNVLHRFVDLAIGNSKLILEELAEEGVARTKLRLLYNGIDPEPFTRAADDRAKARGDLSVSPDTFTIVAVGNLYAYKGHEDLIEACAIAASSLGVGWRLLIAGRDERGNRAVLESLVASRGLTDHITLLGGCDNVRQLLFAADVFVQPSHHEGLPNAIIEAMAASLPVIGTTVGGIPEAVSAASSPSGVAEETGWLVPPRRPTAIASALVEAAEQPDRRVRMGARARARVLASFSLSKSVGTYEAIYRELML